MKWNQWIDYQGSGVKPNDFDQWWNQKVTEINNLPLDYELEKVPIPSNVADFYHLYFIGRHKSRIHCQLIIPKK